MRREFKLDVRVCTRDSEMQQQIIGETHLDTGHLSTYPSALQSSTIHCGCILYA